MGSRQVRVRVLSEGREVAIAEARPVRILPSGWAGVVFGGEVYPLYPADYIDLSDPTFDKHDCMEFVQHGEPIPYASANEQVTAVEPHPQVGLTDSDWYLESNRFGHYVAFNATESQAESIVDALDADLGVRRWDSSHRAADNGVRYQWFARLNAPADWASDMVAGQVRNVLARQTDGPSLDEQSSRVDISLIPEDQRAAILAVLTAALAAARENRTLKDQQSTLQLQNDELEVSLDRLRQQTVSMQQELSATLERTRAAEAQAQRRQEAAVAEASSREASANRTLKRVLEENSSLRQSLAVALANASKVEQADSGTDELSRKIEAQRRRAEQEEQNYLDAVQENSNLTDRLETLKADHSNAQDRIERLQLENRNLKARLEAQEQETRNEASERKLRMRESPRARDRRTSVDEFIHAVLQGSKRLELNQDSIETLLEFRAPARAFRFLTMLANGESIEGVDITSLPGYPGWFEIHNVHIGNPGAQDMGRIYYKTDKGIIEVHVYLKTDAKKQERFMRRWLR